MTRLPEESRSAPVTPPGAVPAIGYLCLAAAIVSYGSLWPTMRLGVQAMPPLWFAFSRMFGASLLLFAVLLAMGRLRLPARQDAPVILSVGVFMMGLHTIFTHLGLQSVGAGRGSLLGFTTPLWVAPMAVLVLRERLGPMKLAGLTLGLAGLAILFNPLGFDWSDRAVLIGNGLVLLAALSWSISLVQMRLQVYRLTPLQLAPWQLIVAAVCAFIGAISMESEFSVAATPGNLALLTVGGPGLTALSLVLGTMTVRHLPVVTASVGFLGVPVLSTLIAWAFLGETLTATLAGGLVVILSGLAVVILADARGPG